MTWRLDLNKKQRHKGIGCQGCYKIGYTKGKKVGIEEERKRIFEMATSSSNNQQKRENSVMMITPSHEQPSAELGDVDKRQSDEESFEARTASSLGFPKIKTPEYTTAIMECSSNNEDKFKELCDWFDKHPDFARRLFTSDLPDKLGLWGKYKLVKIE